MSKFPSPDSCAVRERTANGVSVGRCWSHVPGDECPRHGDVSDVMAHYRLTGKLSEDPREPSNKIGDKR